MTNLPTPDGAIDWNAILDEQANDPGTKPLPAGPQNVFVKDAKVKPASTGSQMINVTFEVEDGPYKSRWLWTNIVFKLDSTNAMRYTLRKLRALGIDPAWLQATNPPLSQVAEMIKGARAIVEVTLGEFGGEPNNDVDSIKPQTSAAPVAVIAGGTPGPTTPGPIGAVPGPTPTPTPTVPTPTAPPATGAGAPPIPNPSEASTETADEEPF